VSVHLQSRQPQCHLTERRGRLCRRWGGGRVCPALGRCSGMRGFGCRHRAAAGQRPWCSRSPTLAIASWHSHHEQISSVEVARRPDAPAATRLARDSVDAKRRYSIVIPIIRSATLAAAAIETLAFCAVIPEHVATDAVRRSNRVIGDCQPGSCGSPLSPDQKQWKRNCLAVRERKRPALIVHQR